MAGTVAAASAKKSGERALGWLLAASPVLVGAPVVLGIAISIVRLIGTAYPDLGSAVSVNSDAEALYLGHAIYQSPAYGYTGMLYTPLFPTVVSLLLRIRLWDGWALMVSIGASVALGVLAARIAYASAGPTPRVVRLLGAVGVGGIAYWLVSTMWASGLDVANTDQTAWALALFGLVTAADFPHAPSRRRIVLAALLISAGFWTKQPTAVVAAVVLVWIWGLVICSALSAKAARLFTAVLIGTNLGVLLVLNLLTHGWEFYFNFEMATRHAMFNRYSLYINEGLQGIMLAAGMLVAVWLVCAVSRVAGLRRARVSQPRKLTAGLRSLVACADPTGRRGLLLGLYVLVGFASAVYFMRKQGTAPNQFVGVLWALSLLVAVGWRIAQHSSGTAASAGACVVLYCGLLQFGPLGEKAVEAGAAVPGFEVAVNWPEVPSELRSWARLHTLYLPTMPDLNVPDGGPIYPDEQSIADVLAAGSQPMYLVRALLDRRFEGVGYFNIESDPYTSGYGKWEENYLWKLDAVIAERYTNELGAPAGVLVRRPGPERAAWMRHCFGPFAAAGASFRIRRGGGFWCSFSRDQLQLKLTPDVVSEVVTTSSVHPTGTITVGLKRSAPSEMVVVFKDRRAETWKAELTAESSTSPDVGVTTYLDGRVLGVTRIEAATPRDGERVVHLQIEPTSARLGAPRVTGHAGATLTAPDSSGAFALVASTGAAINLEAMHLEN